MSVMVYRIILLGWLLTVLTWILFGVFFAVNKYVNYYPYFVILQEALFVILILLGYPI